MLVFSSLVFFALIFFFCLSLLCIAVHLLPVFQCCMVVRIKFIIKYRDSLP